MKYTGTRIFNVPKHFAWQKASVQALSAAIIDSFQRVSLVAVPVPNPAGESVLQWRSDFHILDNMAMKPSNAEQPASFEEAMAELGKLVAQMEAGELPLEASIAAYRRGAELVKYCATQLEKVENQVKVLDEEMLKPFAADAGAE